MWLLIGGPVPLPRSLFHFKIQILVSDLEKRLFAYSKSMDKTGTLCLNT